MKKFTPILLLMLAGTASLPAAASLFETPGLIMPPPCRCAPVKGDVPCGCPEGLGDIALPRFPD